MPAFQRLQNVVTKNWEMLPYAEKVSYSCEIEVWAMRTGVCVNNSGRFVNVD